MNKNNHQKFHMKKKILIMFFCFFINANHSIVHSSQKNQKNSKMEKIQESQTIQKIKKNKKKNEINDNFNLEKQSNIRSEENRAPRSENEVKEIFEGSTILGDLGDNYGR